MVYLCTKFEDSSFPHFKDKKDEPKHKKAVTWGDWGHSRSLVCYHSSEHLLVILFTS